MTSRRIVLAGGGTAGHIEPMLAVADALRIADPGGSLTCLGTARGLEVSLVPARGYELELIPPVPLPRKPTLDLLLVPGRLWKSVGEAGRILCATRAEVVVGFGGYVALPAYLAARRAHIPIVVHEQNSVPGLANRIAARFADVVAVTFPGTPLARAEVVGMPLRPTIANLDRAAMRAQARAHFGLDPGRPTLLVFGGSQGSRSLNTAMAAAMDGLRAKNIQILHAVGGKNLVVDGPGSAAGTAPYVALPYLERMDLAYAAADLALCRAGAVTCAELAAVGLPAVFVPLPIGNGEQRRNAEPVVEAGGGLLVEDSALSPDVIRGVVADLLLDDNRLGAMAAATGRFGRRDAAGRMAELVLAAAR
ncbi:MAG: undecaprenyldiphospho-muramoylpentapeptide beta-N-acetylglucosaminyltransferase [Actinomycetota bacterium]|nr:undecaprenyldiphospho-muramoylpentapeptide beta-N-acetylglucosaminyltransferase [Actinomycetota bacterium]